MCEQTQEVLIFLVENMIWRDQNFKYGTKFRKNIWLGVDAERIIIAENLLKMKYKPWGWFPGHGSRRKEEKSKHYSAFCRTRLRLNSLAAFIGGGREFHICAASSYNVGCLFTFYRVCSHQKDPFRRWTMPFIWSVTCHTAKPSEKNEKRSSVSDKHLIKVRDAFIYVLAEFVR